MIKTIFDQIVDGSMKSWKVWDDDNYMAFLTPFPNTPGMTVVIPKQNPGDDVVELDDEQYVGLMRAVQKVAKLLKESLGVARVAIVFEGTGVAHVHAKLYPLHGDLATQTGVEKHDTKFFETYEGYITTTEGPMQSDADLDAMQAKITGGTAV